MREQDGEYRAADMDLGTLEDTRGYGVLPQVSLLWTNHDPLGSIAAACRMYEGQPTHELGSITDWERRHYWQQARSTHLRAPLEFVKFHFFLEGVDRAFTHQMVRQRTAVYAQESLRFAVVENLEERSTLPPSLRSDDRQLERDVWRSTLGAVQEGYSYLIDRGIPAEDARGLLPHATATRLHYATDLRALLGHAGNRLCTQAQFHWRLVLTKMIRAIRAFPVTNRVEYDLTYDDGEVSKRSASWQFRELTDVFKPVCYELGHCPFNASFDRPCKIRDRVQAFARHGISSDQWGHDLVTTERTADDSVGDLPPAEADLKGISDDEWALDPDAARA